MKILSLRVGLFTPEGIFKKLKSPQFIPSICLKLNVAYKLVRFIGRLSSRPYTTKCRSHLDLSLTILLNKFLGEGDKKVFLHRLAPIFLCISRNELFVKPFPAADVKWLLPLHCS